MTRISPLLERNERFAGDYTPPPLGLPTAGLLVVTCLDHRVDPAIVLGLQLGEAPVIRNAGGRVTPAVIDDIAFLAFLAEQLGGGQAGDQGGTLFEVAVIHHTQCGTGFLADPGFRRQAAGATGLSEASLAASAVADPEVTVKADVERLLASPLLSPKVSVSGHVYDIATGRVTTALGARYPQGELPGERHGLGKRQSAKQHCRPGAGRRVEEVRGQVACPAWPERARIPDERIPGDPA